MMWSIVLILVLLIPLSAVILDSKVGQALARRIEGGAPDNTRLKALEADVDRLSGQVERIQEQSEFLTRLLEERSGGSGELPPGDRPGAGPAGGRGD